MTTSGAALGGQTTHQRRCASHWG